MTDELRAAPRTDAGKRLLKWEREGNVPWDVALECILEIEATILEPAPDVEALREAQATIEAMSGDAADLIDVMDEAAALRTALAHVLVRTHDSGCGTCDAARALLTAEHELPSRAALHPADPSQTPEVETWLAIRAALHEAANDKCRDGRFDHCYDQFHSPPVQLAEWWPPADPSRREP